MSGDHPALTSEQHRALLEITAHAAGLYSASGHPAGIRIAEALRIARETAGPGQSGQTPAIAFDRAMLNDALLDQPETPLSPLLTRHAPDLPWTRGTMVMPASFAERFCFVELMGPTGLLHAASVSYGLYLQYPETFYPAHNHAAEEYYFLLSGDAQWQLDDGAWSKARALDFIHHEAFQRHAMETGDAPLLAMWAWTGDLGVESYRCDGA